MVKILDFGLARRLHRLRPCKSGETDELGMAESGEGIFGTPRYLAPEQTRGEPATFASDVFSLGIVLYELIHRQDGLRRPSRAPDHGADPLARPRLPWRPRPPSRSAP